MAGRRSTKSTPPEGAAAEHPGTGAPGAALPVPLAPSLWDRPAVQFSFALIPLLVAGGPFFLGRGVDIPDDAIYSTISTWEWVQTAWRTGQSPWLVPGKMGGVSLFTEAVQMGPIYPAMALAYFLPVSIALPIAFFGHALALLWAVRWAAIGFGVRPGLATLAGAALTAGPVGLAAFIECQTDTWPALLWYLVILGALVRCDGAESKRVQARWALTGGLALGLLLLGSHMRHSAGTCGALGLWFLLRGGGLRGLLWPIAITAIGLVVGAPGYLPGLLEWSEAQNATRSVASMALPPHQPLQWTFLSSWLAPKPFITTREFGVGALLGATFLVGVLRSTPGVRRLSWFVGLLLIASGGFPGIRWLLFPLTWLAHPTLIIYYAQAMAPAAIVAAFGLQQLLSMPRSEALALLKGPVGVGLGLFLGAAILRLLLGTATLPSPYQWTIYLHSVVQTFAVLALGGVLLATLGAGTNSRTVAFAMLVLLDLSILGIRYHLAIPSLPLTLEARLGVAGEDLLQDGSIHIEEFANLTMDGLHFSDSFQSAIGAANFDYEEFSFEGEVDILEEETPVLQDFLLNRRWPVHLAAARGWRSLSGRVKLPPARQVAILLPLAVALGPDEDAEIMAGEHVVDAGLTRRLFGSPDGLGWQTLALHGIPIAISEMGQTFHIENLAPRCYSPASVLTAAKEHERVDRLLQGGFQVQGPALIEVILEGGENLVPARVSCEPKGLSVRSAADGPSLVVFRERLHPGWSAHLDGTGEKLPILAVNQVHMGVLLPPGVHEVRWRFMPPGLLLALWISTLAAVLTAGGIVGLRREKEVPAAVPPPSSGPPEHSDPASDQLA